MSEREPKDLVQLKIRCREHLRAQLEDSAKGSGHSLNSEIVKRLERSFDAPSTFGTMFGNAFGDQHTVRLLRILGTMLADQADQYGVPWDEDPNRASRYDINLLEIMDVCDEARAARDLRSALRVGQGKQLPSKD